MIKTLSVFIFAFEVMHY